MNVLHSRKPYFKDLSASVKIITEKIQLYFGYRIYVGMNEMYENVHQAMYRFFWIDEMYKLVMDEMYEIG